MSTIKLPNGRAHFRFNVELSGVSLRFRIDWLTRWDYFIVTIVRDGEALIAGRGLHPDIDLLQGLGLEIGTLTLRGRAPTPDNLGVRNELVYTP